MLREGETFDRYEVEAIIGQGGMGTVYRARDTKLGRLVAVKVISPAARSGEGAKADEAPDPQIRARLLREARAAAALDHPNAVNIFDVGEVDGESFIAMELVRGESLRAMIGDQDLPLRRRASMLVSVAEVLAHAHERGLVHRDIKPENIMVRTDGVVKVLDFGIARRAHSAVDASAPTEAHGQDGLGTLTKLGTQVGTPLYMSPEQIRGSEIDGASDQFAWGVTAYELLTGRMPWASTGDALQVAAAIVADRPAPIASLSPTVPAKLAAIVERAMAKRPGDRFASMGALVEALIASMGELVASDGSTLPDKAASAPTLPPVGDAGAPAALGGTSLARYSATELEQVLLRAIDREAESGPGGQISYQELVDAARELGVKEDALRIAAREVRKNRDVKQVSASTRPSPGYGWLLGDGPFWTDRRKSEARSFVRHLGAYVAVNLGFLVIKGELVRGMVGIWGAFVIWHAFRVLFPKDKKSKRAASEVKPEASERLGPRIAVDEEKLDSVVEALRVTTQNRRMRIVDASGSRSTEKRALEEAEAEAASQSGSLQHRKPVE